MRPIAGPTLQRALLVFLFCGAIASPAAATGLRNDPFTRPHLGPGPAPAAATPARSAADASAEPEAPPWQPELRGVMQAGDASVVNIGGSIVAVGESIDGWRLLRVEDGKALFAKGGKRTLLTMNHAGLQKK